MKELTFEERLNLLVEKVDNPDFDKYKRNMALGYLRDYYEYFGDSTKEMLEAILSIENIPKEI